MVAKVFIFLALPALIFAKINIDVVASENDQERSFKISGSNMDIISDTERNTFKLSDTALKDAVKSYFGARPDDAYVRSPTPWGDLYKTYGWPQVTRTLSPQRSKIIEIHTSPSIILTHEFSNNSSKTGTYKAEIKQEVSNTVTHSWEKGGELTIGQEIDYGFDIIAVSGKTSFSYTSKWGQGGSTSKTVTVGSTSEVQVTLEPHQVVLADLYATRGTMKIQLDYEASLSGDTAVNYASTYKGHHFWALDINGVMNDAGLPTTITSREIIEVEYYADSKIVLRDPKTNLTMYSIPLEVF